MLLARFKSHWRRNAARWASELRRLPVQAICALKATPCSTWSAYCLYVWFKFVRVCTASCLEKWFLYDVKSGFCISFSPHMKCHLEFNEGTKIQHREKLLPIKKKKKKLIWNHLTVQPHECLGELQAQRPSVSNVEHIRCCIEQKNKNKKKNIHTFRIAFTARPGHWGGQRIRDHGDESGRLACVDTQKLNSGSDKESIVSESGKGAPLAFIRHKRLIVYIFGCGSARPRRSLYIKMHSTPYLYCIWTFPSSD